MTRQHEGDWFFTCPERGCRLGTIVLVAVLAAPFLMLAVLAVVG